MGGKTKVDTWESGSKFKGDASDGNHTGRGEGPTPELAGQAALADLQRQQEEERQEERDD